MILVLGNWLLPYYYWLLIIDYYQNGWFLDNDFYGYDPYVSRLLDICKATVWSQVQAPRFHFWYSYRVCQICVLFFYIYFTQQECVKRNLIKKWTLICSFLVIHFLKWLMEIIIATINCINTFYSI